MDTCSQKLCHSTQSPSLDDMAARVNPSKPHDMLQLSNDPEKLAIAQTNAANSPLLRLSAELRNEIYNLVLNNYSHLHNLDAPRRERVRESRNEESGNELALLRVCRQLYEETALLPFSLGPFTFHNLALFSKYLAQTLLPSQIAAITALQCPCDEIFFPRLGVYSVFLNLLAGTLTGLKDLTLMEVNVTGDRKEMGESIAESIKWKCGFEVRVELRSEGLELRSRTL
ncbi:hypothetical protein G6011_07490 [Alternaria panax]|uniref:Uncharacterized protein n=1 Tax=Alternaria panax TaxID=48097 RepID=A0AAD4FEW3_9PLEO|nr:hypothetical protein G6011_07490 [Alternaria panax]